MSNSRRSRCRFFLSRLCAFGLLLGTSQAQAKPFDGGHIAQIPAFLPMSTAVPMTEKLPIDGEWIISTIGKRIRIEAGRAYAIDPWSHLFVLQIQPSMVVIRDIRRSGPGAYSGYDLPLMGTLTGRLQADGSLSVSVRGALMPAQYTLIPVRVDDQLTFDLEKSGQSNEPGDEPEPGDSPQPWDPQQPDDPVPLPDEPGLDQPPVNPDPGEAPVSPW